MKSECCPVCGWSTVREKADYGGGFIVRCNGSVSDALIACLWQRDIRPMSKPKAMTCPKCNHMDGSHSPECPIGGEQKCAVCNDSGMIRNDQSDQGWDDCPHCNARHGEQPITAPPAVAAATPLRGIIVEEVWEVAENGRVVKAGHFTFIASRYGSAELGEIEGYMTRVSKLPQLERENRELKEALKQIAEFDEQPIWSDDRDSAAYQMLELARAAIATNPKGPQ